jgi:hypothetical protein
MALELTEIYKSLFETWRSQVDSYWQRSNYFAAFETVALAGCWHLLDKNHLWTAAALSLLGVALTVTWFISNKKTHAYVRHWWRAILSVEGQLNLKPNDFATQIEEQRKACSYGVVIQTVPVLFGIAWVVLFLLGIRVICSCPLR